MTSAHEHLGRPARRETFRQVPGVPGLVGRSIRRVAGNS